MPFSDEAAGRAEHFFERLLVHTKGRWAGVPFQLAEWQRDDIIRPLFGTVNEDGLRQYRTAYIEVPRKNGKSELAAGIALYLLMADGEEGAEVYGAAYDREQAGIVFRVAAAMVRRSPILSKHLEVVDSRKRIVHKASDSFYTAIAADAAGSHGFNASAIIFDELHTQRTRELWDVLTTSTGARDQPLTFAISTAGYDRNSICWEQHEYAERVSKGIVDDPTFLGYVIGAPDEADWTSEEVWRHANPALGDFRNLDEMRAACRKAQQVPALQNTFRRLYLDQWTQQDSRWLDLGVWDASAGLIVPEKLAGRRCFAGLDLATSTDIAACVLVFSPENPEGNWEVLPQFWIPEENMLERARKDRVPYDAWVREGFVHATPGNVIDYGHIEATIERLGKEYDIREVAYDRWGATQISQQLQGAGFTVVPFGQGFRDMSEPTKELARLVLAGRLQHGGNPVLRWMADNLVVDQDPAGNLKPNKQKSREKIDGIAALIMALGRAMRHEEQKPSVYESRGVLEI